MTKLAADFTRENKKKDGLCALCKICKNAAAARRAEARANVLNESESDNATEGVIWKARDLCSAPVEWSKWYGM